MGSIKEKENHHVEQVAGILRTVISFLTICWMFVMLTVFPLYAPEKYQGLGDNKFSLFLRVSVWFLIPGLVLAAVYAVLQLCTKNVAKLQRRDGKEKLGISMTDAGVLLYLTASLLSFLLSDFQDIAWEGVGGWHMGLRTQLLMITAYFLISRFFLEEGVILQNCRKLLVAGAVIGTALTFLLGILHRFDVDPLGMYTGIDSSYKIWFLSTLGQATWYSSFLCTLLPVGVCFFCFYRGKASLLIRIVLGGYCILGFMSLVTQNSDSAFAALGAVFLCLFLLCCGRLQWMKRFFETLMLCAFSFVLTGHLQRVLEDRVVVLGELSGIFTRGKISWIVLLISAGACLLLQLWTSGKKLRKCTDNWNFSKAEQKWRPCGKVLQITGLTIFLISLAVLVTVITWNTQNAAAGGSAMIGRGSYLLFDNSWGSNRGFTWKTTAKIFAEMPVLNKIFGAGPDCYYPYSYTESAYAQILHDFWKPDILTNAHNEFLNLLICIGGFGLISFLFLLVSAGGRFCRRGKKNPYIFMGLLVICSYAAHNFFCYQQVCCTPFLFLVLGIAENSCRKQKTCASHAPKP